MVFIEVRAIKVKAITEINLVKPYDSSLSNAVNPSVIFNEVSKKTTPPNTMILATAGKQAMAQISQTDSSASASHSSVSGTVQSPFEMGAVRVERTIQPPVGGIFDLKG